MSKDNVDSCRCAFLNWFEPEPEPIKDIISMAKKNKTLEQQILGTHPEIERIECCRDLPPENPMLAAESKPLDVLP